MYLETIIVYTILNLNPYNYTAEISILSQLQTAMTIFVRLQYIYIENETREIYFLTDGTHLEEEAS